MRVGDVSLSYRASVKRSTKSMKVRSDEEKKPTGIETATRPARIDMDMGYGH